MCRIINWYYILCSLSLLFLFFLSNKIVLLPSSVTRMGNFWKDSGTNFLSTVAQIFVNLWALLKNITFYVKTVVTAFWTTFGTNWATFNFHIWSRSPAYLFSPERTKIKEERCFKTYSAAFEVKNEFDVVKWCCGEVSNSTTKSFYHRSTSQWSTDR